MPCPFLWFYVDLAGTRVSVFGRHSKRKNEKIFSLAKNSTSQTWTKIQITRFFFSTHEYICFSLSIFSRVADAIVVEFAFSSGPLSLLFPFFCLFVHASFAFHDEKWLLVMQVQWTSPVNRCTNYYHKILLFDVAIAVCVACAQKRSFSFFQIKSTLSGFPFDFPFHGILCKQWVLCCFSLLRRAGKKNSGTFHHKRTKAKRSKSN